MSSTQRLPAGQALVLPSTLNVEEHLWDLSSEGFRDLEAVYKRYEIHRAGHGPDCHAWPMEPDELRMIALLGRSVGARSILELGCGFGYSALFLARGLGPEANIDTVERDPIHASGARENLAAFQEGKRITLHEARELDVIKNLKGPFDLVLHDSGWDRFDEFYDELVSSLRPGGLLVLTSVIPSWIPDDADAISATSDVVRKVMGDPRMFTAFFRQWERFLVAYKLP